ncbi:glycoside hydrolase family 43 protein [Sorangium sp. So ce134]
MGGSPDGATGGTGGSATAGSGASTTGGAGGPATGGTTTTSSAGAGGAPPGEADGYARNPIVSHIFTADPSAHVFEGRVYVYASHDPDDQMGYDMVDYHVFSSDDLVNWQDHGVALDSADLSWTNRLYAPDCAYSKTTGKYYLYFPNSGSAIGVAVSDSPGGPFVDALGKPLIDKNTPGVRDVDWIFDPTVFVDDDGQAYLYFGGGPSNTGDNTRVIRLNEDMISLKDASATTIQAPDFFEASFLHKRDGKYYFSYSTTFDNHAAEIDYMMSDNPMTGFQHAGTILPNPAGNNGNNNHHSVIEYAGSWYIFYHNRVLSNRDGFSDYQRSITLDYLTYDPQGKIVKVSAEGGRVAQLKSVNAFSRMEAETIADQRGIEVEFAEDGGKRVGVNVTDIHDQDWIGISQVDFGAGATGFQARVASGSAAGGTIEILVDGCDGFTETPGTVIGECAVSGTGGWQDWEDISCPVTAPAGVHDLCLRFTGAPSQRLFNLDHMQFTKD